MLRVVIDTDPGIDDAAAIFFALASHRLQVDMLTCVFGNVHVEQAAHNALTILETAGRSDIPVYVGAGQPLVRQPNFGTAIHGHDGLGDVGVSAPSASVSAGRAAERIVDAVMSAPGEITLLAIGPLTNVALALCIEPRLAKSLRTLVLMGGAVRTPGNVTSVATANLFNDPEAAAIVYRSGAPLVQIGTDVCRPTPISHAHLERIRRADNPPARLLTAVTPYIMAFYQREYGHTDGVRYNDVLAVTYLLAPELFRSVRLPVLVETAGTLTSGQTVPDWHGRWGREANVEVCLEVDSAAVADLFTAALVEGTTDGPPTRQSGSLPVEASTT